MIQAPAESRDLVDEIVAKLISKFNPRRIFLFGSRARGDARRDSDYDFLIEIDEIPEGVKVTRQRMTWLSDFPQVEVQVHLRSPGQIERRKDDPGTIDWDVLREGRAIFAREGLPEIRPAPRRKTVRERPPGAPRSTAGWLAHAERDMRLAVHLSSDFEEWKEGICFHSQQAAEKFLKALIISRHERPARTHLLDQLVDHLRRLGIDPGATEDDAIFLSFFAVDVRYPEEDEDGSIPGADWIARPIEVSEADARRAFDVARRIEIAVRANLPGASR
jgi:HEPN domain-containing protein/predicted nucleotidyltransferase